MKQYQYVAITKDYQLVQKDYYKRSITSSYFRFISSFAPLGVRISSDPPQVHLGSSGSLEITEEKIEDDQDT